MTLEEIARIRLEIDDSASKGSLADLKDLSKDINAELRLMELSGEKGSEGWKALKLAGKDVNDEMKALKANIDLNDSSISEMNESLRYWQREAKNAKQDTEEWIEAGKKVNEIKDRIADVTQEMNLLGREVQAQGKEGGLWSDMKGQVLAVFTGTGLFELAKGAAEAIFDFGKEIFETSAKFEKYEAVLKVALGTQEAATKAMDDIKQAAKEMPFTVDELTESYVKYVNRGLQPTMAEMTKMGDIAASQGKSFDQLTEAILDATTGEFERLKEFGIQATKANGEVELSFKGVTKVVKDSPEAIEGALLAFGELEGVQGSMAAMSKTLEGRVSNLGDNFDALKLGIGEGLKPVFGALIDVMSLGIEVTSGLFDGTSVLSPVFSAIGDVMGNVWQTAKSLFATYVDGAKDSGALDFVLDLLVTAIKQTATAFILGLTAVQAFWDGLNIVINKGKELANFFGAEFKIDPKANFDTLQENASKNFASIENMWKGTTNANVKTTEEGNKKQETSHGKTQSAMTLAEKKERDKRDKEKAAADKKQAAQDDKDRKAVEKAEADLDKKIETMKIKSIKDDRTRKIAELNFQIKSEQDAITKSVASQDKKNIAITALDKKRVDETAKIEADFRKKNEAEEEKTRKTKETEEKKSRDTRLKETKAMFDSEFQAATAQAQNELDLTSKNSQAMWAAKKNLLEIELKYKLEKLQQEASAEKERIADSIADTDKRAKAIDNIDTELKAKMSSAEQKFQTDKTKLNDEQNKAREQNNKEFFDVLEKAGQGDVKSTLEFLKKKADEDIAHNKNRKADKTSLMEAFKGLMQGDFTLASKFLSDRVKYDAEGNATQLQNFAAKTQKVADIATQAIGFLKDLNAKWLEVQLANIKKEETEQLDSWKREYDSGKISKEEFEKGNVKILEESKKKEIAARKDAFEREKKMNIAAAVINTAQAALKSFAMFGWPIGLIMAALAAVAGGIQIAAISRQQFSGRDGGVFKNAGVAQGGLHGSSYGQGGISMFDRASGREVGEIEGGEPVMVLSRNTYGNNKSVIDRLLHSSLHKNGAPITMKSGGVFQLSSRRMYEDGGVIDSGGVNVNGMMDENKKSQETMEKTRDNTAKTADNVSTLSKLMQNFQQSGGSQNQQIAKVFQNLMQNQLNILRQIEINQREDRNLLDRYVYNFTTRLNQIEAQNVQRTNNMYQAYMRYKNDMEQQHKANSVQMFNAMSQRLQDFQDYQEQQNTRMYNLGNKFLQVYQLTERNQQIELIGKLNEELREAENQSRILWNIYYKPDGSWNILNAINNMSANLSKAKM